MHLTGIVIFLPLLFCSSALAFRDVYVREANPRFGYNTVRARRAALDSYYEDLYARNRGSNPYSNELGAREADAGASDENLQAREPAPVPECHGSVLAMDGNTCVYMPCGTKAPPCPPRS